MNMLTLIIKDLKVVLSDKKAFVLLVAMPIILFTILSFALAGSFDDGDSNMWTIDLAVVKNYDFESDYNQLKDYATREDAKSIESVLYDIFDDENLSFINYEFMSYDEAESKLENDEIAAIVVLPENYVADLMMNMTPIFRKPIEIEIIKSTEMVNSARIVENIVNEVSIQFSQLMIGNKVTQEVLSTYNLPQDVIDGVLESMKDMADNSPELSYNVSNYQIDQLKMVTSAQYYSVAMMAMFLLFGASYGAKFMLTEKQDFTLQRQVVAGVTSFNIVMGKMALIFCVALLQITLMMLTSIIGFNVYWGEPLYVILLTIMVSLSITGFGAFLAAISLRMNSYVTLNFLESGLFQVLALFGGSYFPLMMMPEWFQTVSKMLLNGAALNAYHNLMIGAPLKEMLPGLISLAINGLVFMSIGLLMIRKESFNVLEEETEVA